MSSNGYSFISKKTTRNKPNQSKFLMFHWAQSHCGLSPLILLETLLKELGVPLPCPAPSKPRHSAQHQRPFARTSHGRPFWKWFLLNPTKRLSVFVEMPKQGRFIEWEIKKWGTMSGSLPFRQSRRSCCLLRIREANRSPTFSFIPHFISGAMDLGVVDLWDQCPRVIDGEMTSHSMSSLGIDLPLCPFGASRPRDSDAWALLAFVVEPKWRSSLRAHQQRECGGALIVDSIWFHPRDCEVVSLSLEIEEEVAYRLFGKWKQSSICFLRTPGTIVKVKHAEAQENPFRFKFPAWVEGNHPDGD